MLYRDYQLQAVDAARTAIMQGHRMIVLVAPCGAGKTVVALRTIELAIRRSSKVLFLTHTEEIIGQTSARLSAIGITHGVIKAGRRTALDLPVQIASIPTLVRRLSSKPPANVVLIDEVHHVGSRTWRAVIDAYPSAVIIGFSATPYRTDGQGLGSVGFTSLVTVAQIPDLIRRGYLVPAKVWGAPPIDLSSVETVAGDFNRGQLGAVMDRPKLVGNVVAHWERLALGRPTIVFASRIDHSKHLTEEFLAHGHAAEHIDGTMSDRRSALDRFRAGETRIITTVALLTEGADFPACSAIVMARPTMSRGMFIQMAGRGLRTHEGKVDCVLIDHAGNHMRHGFVDDPETYSLDGREKRVRDAVMGLRTCLQCFAVSRSTAPRCELCGEPFPIRKQEIRQEDGELQEVTPAQRWAARAGDDARVKSLAKWMKEGKDRGYKPTWPLVRYRALFHAWPGTDMQRKAEEMNG